MGKKEAARQIMYRHKLPLMDVIIMCIINVPIKK